MITISCTYFNGTIDIRGALSAINPIVTEQERAWETVVRTHARVVEAIERRDPKEAEAASIAMIDYTAEEIGRALSIEPLGHT